MARRTRRPAFVHRLVSPPAIAVRRRVRRMRRGFDRRLVRAHHTLLRAQRTLPFVGGQGGGPTRGSA